MEIFKSKKWQAAMVGIIVATIGHFNESFAGIAEQVLWVIMAFIGGQGLADFGKEKAKIETIE